MVRKMKIKAYVNYDERNKIHYYKNFEVVDELPTEEYDGEKITSIDNVNLDTEQGNDGVYNYNYYCINTLEPDGNENQYYVATLKRVVDGTCDDIDNPKYYVDKAYISDDIIYSYESGALDNKYFSTYEEAKKYAEKEEYLLDSNEVFQICNMEI